MSTATRLNLYADSSGGPDACWPWQRAMTRDGYGLVFSDEVGRMVSAHRTAARLALGPIPKGMEVRHSCDNRSCVNPAHLSYGTHRENMADMVERGRTVTGEQHPRHKLTDEQVSAAFQMRKDGVQIKGIAASLGVSAPFMSRLLRGERGRGRNVAEPIRSKRLTDDEIRSIRTEYRGGTSPEVLGLKYGITPANARKIGRGVFLSHRAQD